MQLYIINYNIRYLGKNSHYFQIISRTTEHDVLESK